VNDFVYFWNKFKVRHEYFRLYYTLFLEKHKRVSTDNPKDSAGPNYFLCLESPNFNAMILLPKRWKLEPRW